MNTSLLTGYLRKLNPVKTDTQTIPAAPGVHNPVQPASLCAADLTIEGSVYSESDLIIEGRIDGNVACRGNVSVRGTVSGNISGRSICVRGAEITGDIRAGEAFLTERSTIRGNISAATADVDSLIEGDLCADQSVTIRGSATMHGNITAAVISIEENAVLDGSVRISRPE